MKLNKFYLPIFAIVGLSIACQQKESEKVVAPKPKVATLPAPFKKHLKIQIGSDRIFDVFSWGRGADSTSSLLILRSDSLKNDFSVASEDDINGRLQEVFNTDMDVDGNPEIIVFYTLNDDYQSAAILCYEFNGKQANQIRFPELSSKTKKQYRGLDVFSVKEGMLFRTFHLFEEDDKEGKKSVGKKNLKYNIRNNSFDLEELE